jgi:hypothetical protein
MDGTWGMHERDEKYKILVVNHEGKRPLGIPTRIWEGNVKMDLQHNKMGGCGLNSCGSG